MLTYYGRYLGDPRHGLWVVFLTEWCIKVAAMLFCVVYGRVSYLRKKYCPRGNVNHVANVMTTTVIFRIVQYCK